MKGDLPEDLGHASTDLEAPFRPSILREVLANSAVG